MRQILALLSVFMLGACAGTPIDPGDNILRTNLVDFFQTTNAPESSSYVFKRTDLNLDGRRDAIILMRGPYGHWCNDYGCKMFVLQAYDDRFELLSTINPVREPVYLTDDVTMGWRDIVLRVSGRLERPKDIALRFDGKTYPENPDLLQGSPRGDLSAYERIFDDEGIHGN